MVFGRGSSKFERMQSGGMEGSGSPPAGCIYTRQIRYNLKNWLYQLVHSFAVRKLSYYKIKFKLIKHNYSAMV